MVFRLKRTRRSASLSLSGLALLRVDTDVITGELKGESPRRTIDVSPRETEESVSPQLAAPARPKRHGKSGRASP